MKSRKKRGPDRGASERLESLRPYAVAAGLCVAALAVYANSLGGAFVFDDTVIVQGNSSIQALDLAHLREIFGGHYWKAVESRGGLYRPVVMLSYAVNHALGGERPWGYHLVNVLIHAANGVLVFFLVDALLGRRLVSILAALLFVLHPIRTEGVASIVGRAESLSTLFVLAAWLLYARGRAAALSVAAFVLAMLTKDSTFAFVLLLPLTDLLLGRLSPRGARAALLRYLPYAAALAAVLALRYRVLGGFAPLYVNPSSNPLADAGAWPRFLTATHVFARYLWLLVFPLDLSADYSFNQIPVVTSVLSLRALVPLAVLAGTVAAIVLAARRAPFLSFCGAMFFATFLLTSNWLRPIGTIMAERLMYLPSLGFTCALAYALARGLEQPRWRETALSAAVLLAGAYAWRTIDRNRDWRDHYALFRSAAAASPQSSLARGNYAAVLLGERGDVRGAIEHARAAVEIYPADPAAHFTLGEAYRRAGDHEPAVRSYEEAARRAPRTRGAADALRGAIASYEALGRTRDASAAAERLVEWRPADAAARETRARLYESAGETERARLLRARPR